MNLEMQSARLPILVVVLTIGLVEGTTVSVIVGNLRLKDYALAESNFYALNNDGAIPSIVEGVYNVAYYEQLAGFLLMLPKPSQRMSALQTWHTAMIRNSHQTNAKVLIFNKVVNDEVKQLCGSTAVSSCSAASADLRKYKTDSDNYKNTIVTTWITQVRAHNFATSTNFGSPSSLVIDGRVFEEVLPTLVNGVTSSVTVANVQIVLDFVKGLRWSSHKYAALNALYSRVSDSQMKLMTGFAIKDAMKKMSGPDPLSEAEQKFNSLRARMPKNLNCLLWHTQIRFRNTYATSTFNQYMYSGRNMVDANNRAVYIINMVPHEAAFVLEKVFGFDEVLFNVKSLWWGQYLGCHTSKSMQSSNRMYASLSNIGGGGDYRWRIDLEGSDIVHFYHKDTRAYLYGDPSRGVLLYTPGTLVADAKWRVECT